MANLFPRQDKESKVQPDYGTEKYKYRMEPQQEMFIRDIIPYFSKAVEIAENNKRNQGVLSIPTKTPEEALNVQKDSIYNNYVRWLENQQGVLPKWDVPKGANKEDKYTDFMQKRWAPLGVKNDPDNLNKNWAPNVRKVLQSLLTPEQYQYLKQLNIVSLPSETGVA